MKRKSLQGGYFDELYGRDPDPWRFKTSQYESDKYAATLAALPRAHYISGIEVGCSIGILTRMLAPHCDRLLGVDVAKAAIDQAEQYCADLPNVDFAVSRFPGIETNDRFDLIVLSEVLYYFDEPDMQLVAQAVRTMAMPGAEIICVHWLGPTPDYPMTGKEAVAAFTRVIHPVEVLVQSCQPNYRLDVLRLSGTLTA